MSGDHLDRLYHYFPEFSQDQFKQFEHAIDLYNFWNDKINVVSRRDLQYIVERHLIHSLSIAKFIQFEKQTQILDFGTGGGFPGIPLAIAFPEVAFYLVDSIGKKIKVVKSIVQELNLKNVKSEQCRVEELTTKFDIITCRAVAPLPTIEHWTRNLFKNQRSRNQEQGYILLKGGNLQEEISQSKLKWKEQSLADYFTEQFYNKKKIVHSFPT